MDTVISFTPTQIVAWILATAAAISCIAGAAAWIVKGIKRVQTPTERQNARLTELEDRVARHDKLLDSDKRRIEAIEEGTRVTQKALLALLDHGLSGNNKDQMETAKRDLERYLIER